MISVVLPTYNRANYLSQTIDSCLNQTHKDFELIIVDDCSSDNTEDIVKQYIKIDNRIKYIKNTSNKKLPASLNIGFSRAIGQYFTWTSDDNLFLPTAFEKMSQALDSNLNFGLVYANYAVIDDQGKIKYQLKQEDPEYLPIRDCVGACFLYRADVAKSVGSYNQKLFLVEDYEYWLRMGLVTTFYHINESLYFYRVHKTSLTQTKKQEILAAKLILKKQFQDLYNIPTHLVPINDLYNWYIESKSPLSYFKLIFIICKNPIITLKYILKHIRRL